MPPETVKLRSNFFHNSEILIAYYDSLYFLKHFLLLPLPPFLKENSVKFEFKYFQLGKSLTGSNFISGLPVSGGIKFVGKRVPKFPF